MPQIEAPFIMAHTRSGAAPDVPEVELRLADDAIALWEATEETTGETNLAPPFWAFAWAGGIALARFLIDNPGWVADKAVLDLASGCGVVAIAAAKAGAARVTANEIDPLAAAAIRLNVEVNGVEIDVALGDLLDGDGGEAHLILAGDVFYSRDMADRVLGFLLRAKERGARVLVGDPERAFLPRQRFRALAAYDVRTTTALEDSDIKQTTIWQLL